MGPARGRFLIVALQGRHVFSAAIGFDAPRRRLLIPSFDANTVQIWEMGSVK